MSGTTVTSFEYKSATLRSLSGSSSSENGGVRWRNLTAPIAFSHVTPRFPVPNLLQLQPGRMPFTSTEVKWGAFDISTRVVDYHPYVLNSDWKAYATGRNARLGLLAHAAGVLFAADGRWMQAVKPDKATAMQTLRDEFVSSTIFFCLIYWIVRRGRCLQNDYNPGDMVFVLNRATDTTRPDCGPQPKPMGTTDTEGWVRLADQLLQGVDAYPNACAFASRLAFALLMSIASDSSKQVPFTGKKVALFVPGDALWADIKSRFGLHGQWTGNLRGTLVSVMCTECPLRASDVQRDFGPAFAELGLHLDRHRAHWLSGYPFTYETVRGRSSGGRICTYLPFAFTHYCPSALLDFWCTDHTMHTWRPLEQLTVMSRSDFMRWCFSPKTLYGFISCREVAAVLIRTYVRLLAVSPACMTERHESMVLDRVASSEDTKMRLPRVQAASLRPLIFRLLYRYGRLDDPMLRHGMCSYFFDSCFAHLVWLPSTRELGLVCPRDIPRDIAPHGRLEQLIEQMDESKNEGQSRLVLQGEKKMTVKERVSARVALWTWLYDPKDSIARVDAALRAHLEVGGFWTREQLIRGFEAYCREFAR